MGRSRDLFPQTNPGLFSEALLLTEMGHTVKSVESWSGSLVPQRRVFDGHYARLEPLTVRDHAEDLYHIAQSAEAQELYRYLHDSPPQSHSAFIEWIRVAEGSEDPLFFAVIDTATNQTGGREALMRSDSLHGVVEIGHILWGPMIARTRVATEAFFLLADYVFNDLGCRRLEWKCDSKNLASQRAAQRFGLVREGLFRQHMVVKGHNRDTVWFATIDSDWPLLRERFVSWLDPSNFDSNGIQRTPLRPG